MRGGVTSAPGVRTVLDTAMTLVWLVVLPAESRAVTVTVRAPLVPNAWLTVGPDACDPSPKLQVTDAVDSSSWATADIVTGCPVAATAGTAMLVSVGGVLSNSDRRIRLLSASLWSAAPHRASSRPSPMNADGGCSKIALGLSSWLPETFWMAPNRPPGARTAASTLVARTPPNSFIASASALPSGATARSPIWRSMPIGVTGLVGAGVPPAGTTVENRDSLSWLAGAVVHSAVSAPDASAAARSSCTEKAPPLSIVFVTGFERSWKEIVG